MTPEILYYIWAGLLLIIHLGSLILTMFQLPGNWLIALTTIGFATVIDPPEGMGLTWPLIGFVIGLAALGELIALIASLRLTFIENLIKGNFFLFKRS